MNFNQLPMFYDMDMTTPPDYDERYIETAIAIRDNEWEEAQEELFDIIENADDMEDAELDRLWDAAHALTANDWDGYWELRNQLED